MSIYQCLSSVSNLEQQIGSRKMEEMVNGRTVLFIDLSISTRCNGYLHYRNEVRKIIADSYESAQPPALYVFWGSTVSVFTDHEMALEHLNNKNQNGTSAELLVSQAWKVPGIRNCRAVIITDGQVYSKEVEKCPRHAFGEVHVYLIELTPDSVNFSVSLPFKNSSKLSVTYLKRYGDVFETRDLFTGYEGQVDNVNKFVQCLQDADVDVSDVCCVEARCRVNEKACTVCLHLTVVSQQLQDLQLGFEKARLQVSLNEFAMRELAAHVRAALNRYNKQIYDGVRIITRLCDISVTKRSVALQRLLSSFLSNLCKGALDMNIGSFKVSPLERAAPVEHEHISPQEMLILECPITCAEQDTNWLPLSDLTDSKFPIDFFVREPLAFVDSIRTLLMKVISGSVWSWVQSSQGGGRHPETRQNIAGCVPLMKPGSPFGNQQAQALAYSIAHAWICSNDGKPKMPRGRLPMFLSAICLAAAQCEFIEDTACDSLKYMAQQSMLLTSSSLCTGPVTGSPLVRTPVEMSSGGVALQYMLMSGYTLRVKGNTDQLSALCKRHGYAGAVLRTLLDILGREHWDQLMPQTDDDIRKLSLLISLRETWTKMWSTYSRRGKKGFDITRALYQMYVNGVFLSGGWKTGENDCRNLAYQEVSRAGFLPLPEFPMVTCVMVKKLLNEGSNMDDDAIMDFLQGLVTDVYCGTVQPLPEPVTLCPEDELTNYACEVNLNLVCPQTCRPNMPSEGTFTRDQAANKYGGASPSLHNLYGCFVETHRRLPNVTELLDKAYRRLVAKTGDNYAVLPRRTAESVVCVLREMQHVIDTHGLTADDVAKRFRISSDPVTRRAMQAQS